MNSFAIGVLFLLIAVYFDNEIWKAHRNGYYYIICFLFGFLSYECLRSSVAGQYNMHDEEIVSDYLKYASIIIDTTDEDARIFIIRRGYNGDFLCNQQSYCSSRTIAVGNIGPAENEGHIYSQDLSLYYVHMIMSIFVDWMRHS